MSSARFTLRVVSTIYKKAENERKKVFVLDLAGKLLRRSRALVPLLLSGLQVEQSVLIHHLFVGGVGFTTDVSNFSS